MTITSEAEKDTRNINNVTEDEQVDQTDPSPKNECSYYNYIKSHPASLIAILSAFATIITFIAQLMTYIYSKNTLEYWGFSISYASLSGDSLLYSAMSAIIYSVVLSIAAIWFTKTSDVYIERKKYYLSIKYLIKKLRSMEKDKLNTIKEMEKEPFVDHRKLREVKDSVLETQTKLMDVKADTIKELHTARWTFFAHLIPILILSTIASLLLSLIFKQSMNFWGSVLCIFIIQLLTFVVLYYTEEKTKLKKRQIKEQVNTIDSSKLLEQLEIRTEYPLKNIVSKEFSIKNSTFLMVLFNVFVTSIVFIISIGFSIKGTESNRKAFEIVTLDNKTYAMVYHDEDTFFLEQADISDATLTIHTNRQRIIDASDIEFTVYTFDDVVKIEKSLSN